MKKKLTVKEINAKLQEAALLDNEYVVEDSGPYDLHAGLEPDMDGWDEYVERVLEEGPPEDLEEEV